MLLLVYLAKRLLKTLPIVIVKTHHSATQLNRIFYCYTDGIRVQTMTEAWVANTV